MNAASRNQLIALLLCYIVLFMSIAVLFTRSAIAIVQTKGTAFEAGDLYIFGFAYTLLFNLMATLPLLMVVGYHGLQGAMIMEKVRSSLTLCGLPNLQVKKKLREYTERNGFQAFLLPMSVNLVFMVLLWGVALLPHGVEGMMDNLEDSGKLKVAVDLALLHVSQEALAETWIFFGAYFYAVTTLIRRWMQSDLTTNVLWKLNVRFAVTILLGFLFMALFTVAESPRGRPDSWVLGFAFLAGMMPDMFLRWLTRQVKHLGKTEDEPAGVLFSPSLLQKRIAGMSFWQADRLAEESVESIQDLAMKEIPDLLIRTRFDPALLFDWVDRALLWNQVGEPTVWLQAAGIRSASQLVRLAKREAGFENILQSMGDAQSRGRPETLGQKLADELTGKVLNIDQTPPPPLSRLMLENVVSGLEHGPNLLYLSNYWEQVSNFTPTANAIKK